VKRGSLFDTGQGAGRTLARVLRVYVNSAYPQNGSECSQATRSSLLQLAEKIAVSSGSGQPVTLQKRQLPLIRSAVAWYFSEVQSDMEQVREALLKRLN
jgi:uncharacterized protein YjhX (UPF0386 family)